MFGKHDGDRQDQPDRESIWRWKGVLADSSKVMRAMVAVCLLVESAALTFTQLGFAGIGFNGSYSGYLVVLLQPIAAMSLLFGTLEGALFGLTVGGILYLHSQLMPLNAFELYYITGSTSIVLLAVTGLVLGLCFAVALRHKPPLRRRVLRIALICLVGSCFYSLMFVLNAILSFLVDFLVELPSIETPVSLSEIAETIPATAMFIAQSAGLVAQILADTVLMFISAVLADTLAQRALEIKGGRSLRMVFNAWLATVVFLAFMATAAASFAIFTAIERKQAEEDMSHMFDYLEMQATNEVKKDESLTKLMIDLGEEGRAYLSRETVVDAFKTVTLEGILEGYTEQEDGTVIILTKIGEQESDDGEAEDPDALFDDADGYGAYRRVSDMSVYLTNSDRIPTSSGAAEIAAGAEQTEVHARDALDPEVIYGICESLRTGAMQRVIYDRDYDPLDEDLGSAVASIRRASVSFLLAREWEDAVFVCIRPDSMVFADRPSVMRLMMSVVQALFLLILFVITRLLNQVIVRPIHETNDVLARITSGDLDVRVDERGSREFRSLSDGINTTVDAMKGWIVEAETRMDAELDTAKAIQEASLPRAFPPFPEILHFDIYASMKPARQVGGDFYDFFLIGEDSGPDAGKLGFVIADVSGKGIPAALFMMAAKTQIRDYLQSGMEPGEAIENANRQLCMGNDAGMFVTAFVGVLDYQTGHIDMVNAGHNPPLLWQQGTWSWLRKRSGLPLGLFDGLPYWSFSVDCLPGDQLLLYTDGITEAMNVDEEQYGEARLEQLVKADYDLHPRLLVDALRGDVAQFTRGAEQSDDITVLALEVGVPPELTANLTVFASLDELETVNRFIHTELDRRLCPVRAQNQLDVAIEELFVNIARYAYPDATHDNPGKVWVSYAYCAEPPSITVDFVDEGVPFNPLAKPDAVTPHDIMDVPIGGLGILMAKKSVDSMHYERMGDTNVLRIVKSW